MKALITVAAFSLAILSAPVAAQNTGGATTGTGINSNAGSGVVPGAANTTDPRQRARPEIEKQRALDLQRGASPMTTDPRLGPPSGFDSGGPGSGSRVDRGAGSRGLGSGGAPGR